MINDRIWPNLNDLIPFWAILARYFFFGAGPKKALFWTCKMEFYKMFAGNIY